MLKRALFGFFDDWRPERRIRNSVHGRRRRGEGDLRSAMSLWYSDSSQRAQRNDVAGDMMECRCKALSVKLGRNLTTRKGKLSCTKHMERKGTSSQLAYVWDREITKGRATFTKRRNSAVHGINTPCTRPFKKREDGYNTQKETWLARIEKEKSSRNFRNRWR